MPKRGLVINPNSPLGRLVALYITGGGTDDEMKKFKTQKALMEFIVTKLEEAMARAKEHRNAIHARRHTTPVPVPVLPVALKTLPVPLPASPPPDDDFDWESFLAPNPVIVPSPLDDNWWD